MAETITPGGNIVDSAGTHVSGGTFSNPPVPAGGYTYRQAGSGLGCPPMPTSCSSVDGWAVTGNSVDQYSLARFPQPPGDPSSTQSVDLSGDEANTGHTDGIQQAFPTVAGQTYTVNWELAGNVEGGPAVKTGHLAANGTTFATFSFDTTGDSKTSSATMGWVPQSATFVASSASTTLSFTSDTSSAFGPLVTDISVPIITETQVGIPSIAPCGTGTLTLQSQTDQSWTSDTNLPAGVTFVTIDGNTQVSPSEVKGGPFPATETTLTYQVKVPCSATPGTTLTATTPSTFSAAGGTTASIDVEIHVASTVGSPLVDLKLAGLPLGALVVVAGIVLFAWRRRTQAS